MGITLRILTAVNESMSTENADLSSAQSDYIVILAALCCGLICAIGLAMAARCVCFHRHLHVFSTPPTLPVSVPPPGLNKKILELIPTTKYVPERTVTDDSVEQTECAICLSEFTDGDLMRVLPHCGHVFHVTCIDKWLETNSSCPSCRQLILLVSRCHHCGGFSASQGSCGVEVDVREIDMLSSQDCAHGFLP
ncbi:RING-H2 finger protein ATL80-like [Silene latifolia]|uniref:RING-H2 finger protein ATL80-like n=1 Tax=Silene latifolia TaxID=37657 RepID=UPI003D76DC36